MSQMDDYRHIDKTDKLKIVVTMSDLVAEVSAMNYGVHRFLSELVRHRMATNCEGNQLRLALGIRDLLDKGYY